MEIPEIRSRIKSWARGEPYQKIFPESMIHEQADAILIRRRPDAHELVAAIEEDVRKQKVLCSGVESGLVSCFTFIQKQDSLRIPRIDFKDPCDALFLAFSACLKRPGRKPGTNPDKIN